MYKIVTGVAVATALMVGAPSASAWSCDVRPNEKHCKKPPAEVTPPPTPVCTPTIQYVDRVVYVDRPVEVPGPTVYVNVPGPPIIQYVKVPGPTKYKTRWHVIYKLIPYTPVGPPKHRGGGATG